MAACTATQLAVRGLARALWCGSSGAVPPLASLLLLRSSSSSSSSSKSSSSSSKSSSSSSSSSSSKSRTSRSDAPKDQAQLVEALLQAGVLTEPAAAAMQAVDRRWFVQTYSGVPESIAYQDTVLPISSGQTMPAPSVHAVFLSLLESHIRPGAAVLDLGAGTGYMAACLAQLVGLSGSVLALEKHAKLAERARANIAAAISPELAAVVDVRACNAMTGPPELQGSERFAAIHVGASLRELPPQFVQLLQPGGRIVLPLGAMHGAAPQVIATVTKAADTAAVTQQEHGRLTTRIAPMTQRQDDNIWDS